MTKYLITNSLLNSFQWYLKESFIKTEAEQRQEFLQTLKRVKSEPTEAMQRGIDFENDVFNICNDGFPSVDKGEEYYNIVSKIAYLVKQGLWQQVVKKDIAVGNQEFLLYGKCDVIKADTIYDIKYTSNYELGKFLDSAQHLIYLYCTGLPKFQYLISDGKDYWIEDYHNHIDIENEIKSKISDFLGYLENDKEAKEMFETKWISKQN